jgi:hypothetical protein
MPFAASALTALLLASSAEVPLPPPPPGTVRVTPTAPSAAPAAPATQARPARRVRFVATLGGDFGFTDLLEVELSDGSKRSLTANQGGFLSAGVSIPHLDGRLEAQATLGIKYTGIQASNGSATSLLFPLELLEAVNVAPLRLAAGIVYLHRPSTSGDGVLSDFDVDFESSVGLVLQGEWALTFVNGGGRLSFGPRFVWQKLQVRGGGPVIDANALGAVLTVSTL